LEISKTGPLSNELEGRGPFRLLSSNSESSGFCQASFDYNGSLAAILYLGHTEVSFSSIKHLQSLIGLPFSYFEPLFAKVEQEVVEDLLNELQQPWLCAYTTPEFQAFRRNMSLQTKTFLSNETGDSLSFANLAEALSFPVKSDSTQTQQAKKESPIKSVHRLLDVVMDKSQDVESQVTLDALTAVWDRLPSELRQSLVSQAEAFMSRHSNNNNNN